LFLCLWQLNNVLGLVKFNDGLVDGLVTSLPRFRLHADEAVTVYDLIAKVTGILSSY
jgi:hypothetical protein